MKKSLALLGCLVVIGAPLAFHNAALAQNGGATQPESSNYTGGHAPNNGTGGTGTNPPGSSENGDTAAYRDITGHPAGNPNNTAADNSSSSNYKHKHHSSQTNYAPDNSRSDNDNPSLNSGNKGGGQAR